MSNLLFFWDKWDKRGQINKSPHSNDDSAQKMKFSVKDFFCKCKQNIYYIIISSKTSFFVQFDTRPKLNFHKIFLWISTSV